MDEPLVDDLPPPSRPWVVPAIIVGAVVGVIVLGTVLGKLIGPAVEHLPVTDDDRTVLVTVDSLAPWFEDLSIDRAKERVTKKRMRGGQVELEYEYEAEDLYLSTLIYVEPSESAARSTYRTTMFGFRIGTSLEDVSLRPRPDLLSWGEESRCEILWLPEEKAAGGNLFACRMGKRTFLFVVGGVYFDEPDQFRQLLEPVLQRWETYTP